MAYTRLAQESEPLWALEEHASNDDIKYIRPASRKQRKIKATQRLVVFAVVIAAIVTVALYAVPKLMSDDAATLPTPTNPTLDDKDGEISDTLLAAFQDHINGVSAVSSDESDSFSSGGSVYESGDDWWGSSGGEWWDSDEFEEQNKSWLSGNDKDTRPEYDYTSKVVEGESPLSSGSGSGSGSIEISTVRGSDNKIIYAEFTARPDGDSKPYSSKFYDNSTNSSVNEEELAPVTSALNPMTDFQESGYNDKYSSESLSVVSDSPLTDAGFSDSFGSEEIDWLTGSGSWFNEDSQVNRYAISEESGLGESLESEGENSYVTSTTGPGGDSGESGFFISQSYPFDSDESQWLLGSGRNADELYDDSSDKSIYESYSAERYDAYITTTAGDWWDY